ncbi:MAG: hypothetical protein NT169_06040 [Chloroflexi bacterium]|nr:hypothetical protein [Chloroflexota bacterium]
MFDPTSRYYRLETATLTLPDGAAAPVTAAGAAGDASAADTIAYVRRRFLLQGDALPLLMEVTVSQGDRLDLITARALGDSTQFWRVCDANNAMAPLDLVAEPGRTLRVPIPQA